MKNQQASGDLLRFPRQESGEEGGIHVTVFPDGSGAKVAVETPDGASLVVELKLTVEEPDNGRSQGGAGFITDWSGPRADHLPPGNGSSPSSPAAG